MGDHPDFQRLHPPGQSLATLAIVADCIDALFQASP